MNRVHLDSGSAGINIKGYNGARTGQAIAQVLLGVKYGSYHLKHGTDTQKPRGKDD